MPRADTKGWPVYRMLLGILLLGGVAAGLFVWKPNLLTDIHDIIRWSAPVPVFLLLFLLLPLVGFPVSLLFVVAGARLGLVWGLVAMLLVIPLHLTAMFGIAAALRRQLMRLLQRRGVSLPQLPQDGRWIWIALFSLIPGLSYTIKNYTLPLSGTRFRELFGVVWPVQIAQNVPLVLVGSSVSTGSLAPLVTGILLLLVFVAATPRVVRTLRILRSQADGGSEDNAATSDANKNSGGDNA